VQPVRRQSGSRLSELGNPHAQDRLIARLTRRVPNRPPDGTGSVERPARNSPDRVPKPRGRASAISRCGCCCTARAGSSKRGRPLYLLHGL